MEKCMATAIAAMGARLHIEEIRSQKFSIGKKEPNPLTQDLHHAVTSLSAELYTKDVHFLMEIIQNAEDNEYQAGVEPTLEFVLTKDDISGSGAPATLLIFNNEVGFSEKNMESICSVGRSTKKGKRRLGFIGEKGIGFKSVFLVSALPHIYSNGYQVRFSEEPNRDCGIGYIVPEWVSGKPHLSSIHDIYGTNKVLPTTTIILPLKPGKVEAVKAQLSELHPELLLFLSKIKRLYVRGNGCDPNEPDNVSAISISSETDHVELREKRADSRVVQLSVKEKMSVTEETCRYYMWRQALPVKCKNKVSARMDVEEWVITLAFPFGNRLQRGTSSAGIFAFLPTAMVTNFPFVIQADFILASSRETILLDNKWNLGILDCVPSVFLNAFVSCLKRDSPLSSVAAFEFLPAQASPIPKLNEMRESIRSTLKGSKIVPCEMFSGKKLFYWPSHVIRILPDFRKLLSQMKSQGVPLGRLSSLNRYVLHSSLDLERYSAILDFLGVVSVDNSYQWYAKCIQTCRFAFLASEDVYIKLLCFIADNKRHSLMNTPFLKYVNSDRSLKVCPLSKTTRKCYKVHYAVEPELHSWLSKCNLEFGCPDNNFMLPDSMQKALVSHSRSLFLQNWLSSDAGVTSCSAYEYGCQLNRIFSDKINSRLAVHLAQFLYYSHRKMLMSDSFVSNLCQKIPVIDGSGHIRIERSVTLVSAPGSKWVSLLGASNPFVEHKYVELGDVYAKSCNFAGECTPEKDLLIFLSKQTRAVDIPELYPPNVALEVASSELTCEQAFLLLDWIRSIRTYSSYGCEKFIKSIRDGKWLKMLSGFNSPSLSILPDAIEEIIFDMMKSFLDGFSIVDQEFYMNKISLYKDELKFLGVRFGFDMQRLVCDRSKLSASSEMSKERALSLLMFIRYLKERNMLDEEWLEAIRNGKWLRTSHGYAAPKGSVLLQSEREAEAVLSITNIPVVDKGFYGRKIASFSSELMLLGVVLNLEEGYKLIAENFTFPANLSSLRGNCGLLILKCIRYMGSASSGLVEKIRNRPWLKTSSGIKSPPESILPDPLWSCLLNGFELPIIDEAFYGDVIRSFVLELKAVGVAVEFSCALKMMIGQFKSLTSSSSLTPANVISLLDGIRETSQNMPFQMAELCKCLSGEEWLKTRHGYRTPCESILFNSKWGTISLFVDLPLVDDCFYGISIYGYKDELKMLGVVTDFMEGAPFVARGLNRPIEPELLTADSSISLLECIKFMMLNSHEQSLLAHFITNLKSNKWLKSNNGYRKPEECIMFDPAWEGILYRTDAPTIDEKFYETDITVYKDQLRATGVKVDTGDVCTFLSGLLLARTDTMSITRVYRFLKSFNWKPETIDKSNSWVWIPTRNGTGGGEWVNSQLCILHDKNNLFGSHLYSLDRCYMKKLLPLFSSAFGVAEFPSIDDYLQLWNSWVSRDELQVTVAECCSFWEYVLDNWNSQTEDILRQNLTRIPGTTSSDEEIYLLKKEEVFIPDDLQLKKVFSSAYSIPLFAWFPKRSISSSVSPGRLYEIYGSLGVRKISESVEWNLSCASLHLSKKIDPRNGLIGKGLIKIILGFLAGSESYMPVEKRHKAAKSLLNLSVCESEKPIEVNYRLMQSADMTLEVKTKKMVLWKKNSQQLFIDKSDYEDWKTSIEFVTCFAQEIAEGLLTRERADAVNSLSKIIQMGFVFEFKEDAVDFLLAKENLELFMEDEDFLGAAFPFSVLSAFSPRKRKLELAGPSTPEVPCKKLCQK